MPEKGSKEKQQQSKVPSLRAYATRSLPHSLLQQHSQDVEKYLRETQTPITAPYYKRKAQAFGHPEKNKQQIQRLASAKQLEIYKQIQEKEKTGFDVFPVFFFDLPYATNGEEMMRRFGAYTDRFIARRGDAPKSIFLVGTSNRVSWFIVNWFDDERKKVFVLYHNTDQLPPAFLRLPRTWVLDKQGFKSSFNTYVRTSRLLGVYEVDMSAYPYNYATNQWILA